MGVICVGIKGWGIRVRIRVRTGSYLSKVSESRMGTGRVWWHSWGKVCVEEMGRYNRNGGPDGRNLLSLG